MPNAWFRAYSEFAHDAKVQMMSEAMQRRLFMIFCLRCEETLGTSQEQEIAFALRISDVSLAETKALFIEKGFVDEDWNVLHWNARQFLSDSSTDRTRRYRERRRTSQEQAVTESVTAPEQNRTDTEQIQKHKKQVRGTRLPANFTPTQSHLDIATERRLNLLSELAGFQDYFKSAPGKSGVKLDWDATFRNWLRNSRNGGTNGNGHYETKSERLRRELGLDQESLSAAE